MSKTNLLLSITNGVWLIEPGAIHQFGPIVKSLLEGNISAFEDDVKTPQVTVIDPSGAISFTDSQRGFNNAPPNSTAVITIAGAIMKNDNCGDPGTASLSRLVKQADGHPNISSIVLKIDSPGGTFAGTEDFAKVIKDTSKPVVAYVDGLMASAAYWIGSQAIEIYSGNKTDQIGSIGTMLSFADAQPYWEKMGVKFHEIYASQSTDKNKDFAEARQGNYKAVINRLDALNQVFLDSVKAARGEKLNTKETLTGKVFMAEDAVAVGLIDGIKSFEEVVARAQELASKTSNNNQPQKTMKIKAKFAAMTAFLMSAFTGFKAEETELSDEHLEKINSELATLDQTKADLKKAQDDLVAANQTIETLNADKATLTTEKANLTSEVATLKTKSAGATETSKTGDDKVEGVATDWQIELAALPHNQAVDNNPLFSAPKK